LKKTLLINQEISSTIAGMGHMDMLVIGDAGLPIPDGIQRIDLALSKGIPSFVETVEAVLSEMEVQTIIIADEMKSKSPQILAFLTDMFPDVDVQSVPHEAFKAKMGTAKAVIRTGEYTPYANVILISGVVF